MKKDYRIIAVTPAGRARYLEILVKHLEKHRPLIDEWHLWLNTADIADIEFCQKLAKKHSWIKTIPLNGQRPWNGSWSIHHFFEGCIDPKAIYIRFDDDILWIEDKGLDRLVDFRIENPEYFLIFPNIINNSLMSHIHQRLGLISLEKGICEYAILDNLGWNDPIVAQMIHDNFLYKLRSGSLEDYKFPQWILYFQERFSINSFCFFGKDFAKFSGKVGIDEEVWLSEDHPRDANLMNCVFGKCLMVHFAYHTQRDWIEQNTPLLSEYKRIAGA